ncbi:MAG: hypothetical protein ACLQMU_02920 [Methanoregula sp.]|uniref:hypothetical protein n=1 Tax=Methanoregula sp. TaxID=2052170 RepID=UPI003C3285BF
MMKTPFDEVIDHIVTEHYHNHRQETHSDLVSQGIFRDLMQKCPELRHDIDNHIVQHWLNVKSPTKRGRKMDLLIGEPDASGNPDLRNVRICIENKSVITAHRNRDARFDDLYEVLQDLHGIKSEIIMGATVMVGMAERVLNIPDGVKSHFKKRAREFQGTVVPRLSSGDQKLWDDFPEDISENRANDPVQTMKKFQALPTRKIGLTHVKGYDYILYVPVFIDNVNPPYLARENNLGIDIDAEYQKMLNQICSAYRMRWHL